MFQVLAGDETCVDECPMTGPCDAVVTMLEQFGDLYRLGAAPPFLLSFIEDCLSDILARSLSLVELLEGVGDTPCKDELHTSANTLTADRVVNVIGCDYSDLRLITHVAAVYCPAVLQLMV